MRVAHVTDRLMLLQNTIGDCRRCQLSETRDKIIFGTGNPSTGLVVISESPTQESFERLKTMGLTVEPFITSLTLCPTPFGRPPFEEEMLTCKPHLHGYLHILDPKVIVMVGKNVANALLKTKTQSLGAWVRLCETKGAQKYRLPVSTKEVLVYVIPPPEESEDSWRSRCTYLLHMAQQCLTT
jgi:DNA polymerase